MWRVGVALVLVASLGMVFAAPAGAQGATPTLDSFDAYCYKDQMQMSFTNLYGVVEFVVDADDVDDDLCYLEIDLYPCGVTCIGNQMLQLNVCADPTDIFQDCMTDCASPVDWSADAKTLAAAMGLDMDNSYYDGTAEAWHLIIDLTKLWSPEGATIYNAAYGASVVVGDPVFPKCHEVSYEMCIEVGDAEGNQYGDNSSCTDCYTMEFYGMHLLSPNEFEPVCTTQGESVEICWNFHADCDPEEDFLIEIYDPDTGTYAAWPGYFTVTNLTVCDCVTHCVDVPLLAIVPDGKYNVKITSTCDATCTMDCTKRVEEEDAVIVDTVDPTVTVISPDTDTNLKDCDDLDVFWTHDDNTGVTRVLIEYSTTGCAGTWSTLDDLDQSKIAAAWNAATQQYEKDYHVSTTPLTGIDTCNFCVRVTAFDCGGSSGSDNSGAFIIDNTAPVVTVVTPDGGEVWEGCTQEDIEWTVVENCVVVNIKIEFSEDCGSNWKTIAEGALTSPYSWHVDPTVNSTDCHIRITATDCPGNTGSDDSNAKFKISSPPMLFDAITGWTWAWGPVRNPVNSNTIDSIMVMFNKVLDLDTVEITDFAVIDPAKTITDMEIHTEYGKSPQCQDWPGWTTVFLTVDPMMTTDETPTVQIVGEIKDTDGIALLDKLPEGAPDGLPPYQEKVCQDGIAPLIEVSADPAKPGYNQMVTITVVAGEELSEAYLYIGHGYPDTYTWCEIKPIGWPPRQSAEPEDWTDKGWLFMTEGEGNTWTVSFRNKFGPDTPWFVEVAAHDFTEWEAFPWKHEKWTEESLIFEPKDNFFIKLYEGWNLISVPRDLIDPSLVGFFGGKGVTRVFYYNAAEPDPELRWLYAALIPETGQWLGTLTTIEPGKGYWVWCSPPWTKLLVRMKPIDPLAPPPSYNLVAGWNMIGVTMLNPTYFAPHGGKRMFMHDYLSSLGGGEHGNATWSVLYWYYLSGPGGSWGWLRTTPNSLYEMIWWCVYWNEWSCPMAIPGHGYWIFMNQDGVLAP